MTCFTCIGAESRTTAALTTGTTEALTPPVDLGKDRIPPAWGKGVDYVLDEPPAWTIPGHDLPKPVADKQRLHPDGGWPFPASKSKSTPMQVNFGTLVYKGPRKTFLVVAAVVSSGGAMVHTVESTEGLRCGYFQESIEVTMRPTADNITRSPKGTFPQNVVGEAVLLEKTVETGNTAAAGLNLGVTVNPATGTAVGPALTTSFARSKKETDKTSGVARAWLAPVFKSDGAKLTWTAELGMYRDGTEYVTSMGKDAQGKLRDVPDFVKGDVGIEVQGTWELPKELREVTVELSVKQVLRYSALKGWPRKELKHFDDHNGPQTKVIEVNTVLVGPNVQKSTSDALPFWEG